MPIPLYRSRPGGFDIQPASQPAAVAVAEGVYVSEGLSNSYLVVTSEGPRLRRRSCACEPVPRSPCRC